MGTISVCVTLDIQANTRPVRRTNSYDKPKKMWIGFGTALAGQLLGQNRRTDAKGYAESTGDSGVGVVKELNLVPRCSRGDAKPSEPVVT